MNPVVLGSRVGSLLDYLVVSVEENSVVFWNLVFFFLPFEFKGKLNFIVVIVVNSQIRLELLLFHQDVVQGASFVFKLWKKTGVLPVDLLGGLLSFLLLERDWFLWFLRLVVVRVE